MTDNRIYQIAFSNIPDRKRRHVRQLLGLFGSPEAFFMSSRQERLKLGLNPTFLKNLDEKALLKAAESELGFMEKEDINLIFMSDNDYPERLRHCEDAPLTLYTKGKPDLNSGRFVSIVGTRTATAYGRSFCEQLVTDLAGRDITIVSGLAMGIDVCAHLSAMKNGLPTIGVLGHGLDRIYPAKHSEIAGEMQENGGIVTEFCSFSFMARGNFPARNRIIAGLSDATIVVESKSKGGSLITADIANSYNREVFAVPGRTTDLNSQGCNALIKENLAILLECTEDFLNFMNWNEKRAEQTQLQFDLSEEGKKIMDCLSERGVLHIDEISVFTDLPHQRLAGAFMELELNGLLSSLPGNRYQIRKLVKY